MSFHYIENVNPTQDPNTDLNFNNDILYENLVRYYARSPETKPKNGDVVPEKGKVKERKQKEDNTDSSNLIYILFIFIVILAVILWYVYNNSNKNEGTKSQIDLYKSDADLSMLSPDFGNDVRYGIKKN